MTEYYPPPDKRQPPAPSVAYAEAAALKAAPADKYVATLVELVSGQRLLDEVTALAAFHTRHTFSAGIGAVADQLVARLAASGYAGAAKVAWTHAGHTGQNVVAIKPGTGAAPRLVVVCAHYDCRMQVLSDATARAPGADDNASGVAALLEIARVLAGVELADTVRFVAFSGEEQGLWGSTAYAAQLAAQGLTVDRLINLDMIGFPPADGSVTVERDLGNAVPGNDAASVAFGAVMADAAATYTSLPVALGPIYASDYMPFEARGWVTIGAYEGEGNPNYHHTSDDVGTLDLGYLTAVTKMTLATLALTSLSATGEAGSGIDLFIRDSPADTGAQPSGVPHWTSPDIWVRTDGSAADDPELGHQPPIVGQPNFVYVRVRNRGTVGVAAGAATVTVFGCQPGTGMVWPADFTEIGGLAVLDPIPAGGSARVGPFTWTPTVVGHECLLAIARTAGDGSVADVYPGALDHGLLVRFDNNVGQRNVAPVLSVPSGGSKVPLWVRGGLGASSVELGLDAGGVPAGSAIRLRVPPRLLEGARLSGLTVAGRTRRWCTLELPAGGAGSIAGLRIRPGEAAEVTLLVELSARAEDLRTYPIVVSQTADGAAVGKQTIEITAVAETAGHYLGNRRSREVHVVTCPWWPAVALRNREPFLTLADALARGYDGCAVCLPEANTG